MPIRSRCAHCKGPIRAVYRRSVQTYTYACWECKCRFNQHGELLRWGKRCPYLVRA